MKRVNFTKADAHMTVKELKKRIEANGMTFDNAVQRGNVWDNDRKSLLIDSILQDYEVPVLYAKRTDNGVYDMLDGKQRSTAIFEFINDEFPLTNVSDEFADFEDMYFSQLDEEMQDAILDFQLTIRYFDGITDDEVKELFFRLNNGKPLTNFEQIKAKCKSLEIAKDFIAENEIFKEDKMGKTEDKRLELFFKAWTILFVEYPSLEKKQLNPIMTDIQVTDEQIKEMNETFDYIYNGVKYLDGLENDQKLNEKARKRILTATHFLSLLPIAHTAIEDNIKNENFIIWARDFYSGGRRASIDDVYNDYATRGSAKADSIAKRNARLVDSYTKRFSE